jgi:hypothetical protein
MKQQNPGKKDQYVARPDAQVSPKKRDCEPQATGANVCPPDRPELPPGSQDQ